MAVWTSPATVVTGDVITAAWGNTYVRDNTTYLFDEANTKTYRISQTWAIPGEIVTPSGDVDYIVPFYVPALATGQTATLKGLIARINSGTSATVKLARMPWGGAEADLSAPYASISVTTTDAETTGDVSLAAKDRLRLVVTGISGAPKNMTVSLEVELVQ